MIGYIPARLLRISYAGELGFEIYVPAPHGRALWDSLVEAGRPQGLAVCRISALDSLRIEKGYRLTGADLHGDRTALEAGLGWSVSLKKQSDFIGCKAIEAQKAAGPPTKLSCLTLEGEAFCLARSPSCSRAGRSPISRARMTAIPSVK